MNGIEKCTDVDIETSTTVSADTFSTVSVDELGCMYDFSDESTSELKIDRSLLPAKHLFGENYPNCAPSYPVPSRTYDHVECYNEHIGNELCKNQLNCTNNGYYTLRPLKVECLQSLTDLKKTCATLGLKFCGNTQNYDEYLKSCSVQALYPYENIGNLCDKLRLKFNSGSLANIKLKNEVDFILDHKLESDITFYFVKWKRRSMKHNSWIPEITLLSKYKHLVSYYKVMNNLSSGINQQIINHFIVDLLNRRPRDILTLVKLCALIFNISENFVRELSFNFKELRMKAKSILNIPIKKLNRIKGELFEIMQFAERRKHVLINLEEWEKEINGFNPATYVEVENNMDLEMAPSNFQFIHDYVRAEEYVENPICFCSCNDCYENKNACCSRNSDGVFPYNKFRRLILLPGYPIYECNKLCKCDDNCINRVVQHGQKVKVAIFRTSNGCGWGLKTLEVIQKDQFVLEYLGEIITSEEAEARGEIYDFIGRTYLFDLDYGDGNNLYTVDAGHMGNAGHFINHSCEPNLHVFAVWINNPDPNLPRLALFSKRKINRGEELTFDYKMVKNRDEFACSPVVGVECKCNSKNCRKYLF